MKKTLGFRECVRTRIIQPRKGGLNFRAVQICGVVNFTALISLRNTAAKAGDCNPGYGSNGSCARSRLFTPSLKVWRGAPRSPDFLSRLVASANFMRLSLLKGAHAVVSRSHVTGNPGSPQRTWDENGGAKPLPTLFARARDTVPERTVPTKVKAIENIVFGPCTLGRTWGTPPHRQPRSITNPNLDWSEVLVAPAGLDSQIRVRAQALKAS